MVWLCDPGDGTGSSGPQLPCLETVTFRLDALLVPFLLFNMVFSASLILVRDLQRLVRNLQLVIASLFWKWLHVFREH